MKIKLLSLVGDTNRDNIVFEEISRGNSPFSSQKYVYDKIDDIAYNRIVRVIAAWDRTFSRIKTIILPKYYFRIIFTLTW